MSKIANLIGFTAAAALMSCSAVSADQSGSEDMVSVWSIDRSGAPPFKRQLVQVPATDIAALEIESGPLETVTMRVVDFRGKPPFRRRTQEVPVIDVSSLEVEAVDKSKIKPKSFFKRIR